MKATLGQQANRNRRQ